MQRRLQSLDIVRGFTVAGMILVNNGYSCSFEMLRHAQWNGLSVSDFVFPFFLFIMGVSMCLSFSRHGMTLTGKSFVKVLKRSVLLFVIGIAINWFDMAIYGGWLNFGELRFFAVLQRIALCYFLGSLFVLTMKGRYVLPMAVTLLVIYTVILLIGNGYSTDSSENILSRVDTFFFGEAHLYHKSAVDPEGLLGTISSLANVLFGFYCGMRIKANSEITGKVISLFAEGTVLVCCGFIVDFFMPYNKRIWSPSFALVTSGACSMLFALCMKWTDMDGKKGRVTTFFTVFGVNALALYVVSELMAIIFGKIGVCELIFSVCSLIPVAQLSSLAYALIFVFLNFIVGYLLWKRNIYIKL